MPLFIDIPLNFQVDSQKQFIILCGNITYVTVTNFLDDFFHPAREDVNCEVLILNKMSPDLELEGLLKRRKTQVQYFQVNSFGKYFNFNLSLVEYVGFLNESKYLLCQA